MRWTSVVIGVCIVFSSACGFVGVRDLSEAAKDDVCDAAAKIEQARSQPNAEAVRTYRSAADTLSTVAAEAPSRSTGEKSRKARLLAIASQARLASIHAQTGNDRERKAAEHDMADMVAEHTDCP